MVGKNNWEVQLKRGANKVKRYTIKRTSVGVVSAVVAAGLIFGQETSVQADEITAGESQTTEVSSEAPVETEENGEEVTPTETSQVEATAEENGTVSEIDTEKSSEPVYEQTEVVAEEVSEGESTEYDDVVADSTVADQEDGSNEAIVETTTEVAHEEAVSSEVDSESETAIVEDELTQEDDSISEDSTATSEDSAIAQPQMSAFATVAPNSVEGDTEFPELLDIYTDKDAYQAGEDIKVTVIARDNIELNSVSLNLERTGNSQTGPNRLYQSNKRDSTGFVQQVDGTYKVDLVIKTDEKMPSNSYQLDWLVLSDTSENDKWIYTSDLPSLKFSINIVNIPYETIRELNTDLIPGSEDVLAQVGVNGSADATTGVVINAPIAEIIHYAPVEIPFEVVEVVSEDLYLGETNVTPGQIGLLDPETDEVIVAPVNEIVEVGSKVYVAPEEIAFEVERILDMNLSPESGEVIVQEGQVGYRDGETGEVISEPVNMVVHYAPTIIDHDVIRTFNPERTPNSGTEIIQYGDIGLMDPITNEIIIEPIAEISEFAPVTIGYEVEHQLDDSLEPNSNDHTLIQAGAEGLQNPETGEVILSPVNEIVGIAPSEYIDDTSIQNIITVIDRETNHKIANVIFLGNNYAIRQNYFINQLNNKHNLALEVVGEDGISKTISTATGNGYTVTSTKIKKNVYVLNNNNTDISSIKKPFLPEGIIYNNLDYERIYRKVSIQDNYGSILYSAGYVAYESTDDTIRGAMSNISSSDYYYDSVEVSEGFTTVFGSMGYYRGPLKKITILVNQVEDIKVPETPVEPEVPEVEEPETPEVPEVEEPETPVEPEVPEVEEPETPVEPEVPEVEEPETPVEPEVPEVEEPETPVEPEIPEVEEPETPVEPEVPEVEEPETPVEPEVPEVEEPETPVEPEVPEVEEPETPVEPEIPAVEEPETPTNPEVPVVEEPETPAEPETPVAEDPETVVESEVPTNDVKAPVATSEDGVVVAEPIPTPAQTVATEGAKAESEVVVAETGSKVAETVLSAEVKPEESSTTVDDQVATLPAAGAQTMSALATGLGVITTALGAVLVRKKK
ncbi:YSIRK-type signal peptide-containing protein [Aerococcus urinaeequi]|uniref:YSIRK-type signal peptide-containing protein n=1 Tax=Aerococcus urinaeequi TaxID=51665 RepID=UPI003D6BAF0C